MIPSVYHISLHSDKILRFFSAVQLLFDASAFCSAVALTGTTVSTSRTEVLCCVCGVHAGDPQLSFASCIPCEPEASLEVLLHARALVGQQSDQRHDPPASCSRPELVPEHVGIVVVSMVTVQNHLSAGMCENHLRRLLDHERRQNEIWRMENGKKCRKRGGGANMRRSYLHQQPGEDTTWTQSSCLETNDAAVTPSRNVGGAYQYLSGRV